ncbi:glycosyltransferase family 2 protein [Paenibacillus sp. GCM10012307]|uniref:Glycosyltransferase n=1 Tax=Paenibacillus roseus TaxID=2798579 RepID=A0A934MPC0_9BACL|nr:glycosyltransferase [Paenibacillus roseus]MBJ6360264.1 glycosyltransferase [Paenibacillus roseus]
MISVLIPTYNASHDIRSLLTKLYEQDIGQNEMEIIVIDSSSTDSTVEIIRHEFPKTVLEIIPNESFDHGGTRNRLAAMATGEFLLFMTQDAIPYDLSLLSSMHKVFNDKQVAVCFARQIPKDDAGDLEIFARGFNYPETSLLKTKSKIEQLGIKTFFNSNVCSMYRKEYFNTLGGFPERIILNEDMIFASRAIFKDLSVYYCAEARVYHSHNYTIKQQFKRYFDIGMAFKDTEELFKNISNEKEGMKMIVRQTKYLLKRKRTHLIAYALAENICKLFAYQLGKKNRLFPYQIKKQFSAYLK